MRILLFILMAVMFVGAASAGQNDRVQLRVKGHVTAKCELNVKQNTRKLELHTKTSSTARVPLDLKCNTPFKVRMQAENGRLKLQDSKLRGAHMVPNSVPYEARLRLPVRSPKPRIIRRDFKGRELLAGRSVSTGNAISSRHAKAELILKTQPQPGRFLVAGRYKEVIKVSVSPI